MFSKINLGKNKISLFFLSVLCSIGSVSIFFTIPVLADKHYNDQIVNYIDESHMRQGATIGFINGGNFSESKYLHRFKLSKLAPDGKEYRYTIQIDYDYLKLCDIPDREVNDLIGLYFSAFEKIFNSVSYEFLYEEDSIISLLAEWKEFVDSNIDERVIFSYTFGGLIDHDNDIRHWVFSFEKLNDVMAGANKRSIIYELEKNLKN